MEEFFEDFLLPVFCAVVLPVSIVLIASLTDKAKYQKKFSFLEKCVENGVEINPDLLVDKGRKTPTSKAALKIMLLNRLAAGVILLVIGIGLSVWSVISHVKDLPLLSAVALTAVGIGLLVWYHIGRKMLAEDMNEGVENLDRQSQESGK